VIQNYLASILLKWLESTRWHYFSQNKNVQNVWKARTNDLTVGSLWFWAKLLILQKPREFNRENKMVNQRQYRTISDS